MLLILDFAGAEDYDGAEVVIDLSNTDYTEYSISNNSAYEYYYVSGAEDLSVGA